MNNKKNRKKHPLYRRWTQIRYIKMNANAPDHSWAGELEVYGLEDFDLFLEMIETTIGMPEDFTLRLNRIDQKKGWIPGNLRWADQRTVVGNNSAARCLTYQGETHCITHWSVKVGLNTATLHNRLHRGWTAEEILTTPPLIGVKLKSTKKDKNYDNTTE